MRCGDDIQWKSFAVAVAASLSCGCVWRESRRCVRARPSAPGRSIVLLADILLDLVSDLFASVRGRPGWSVSGVRGVCGVGQRHHVIHARKAATASPARASVAVATHQAGIIGAKSISYITSLFPDSYDNTRRNVPSRRIRVSATNSIWDATISSTDISSALLWSRNRLALEPIE